MAKSAMKPLYDIGAFPTGNGWGLYALNRPVMLIASDSGILFRNQVGCVECIPQELRGWLIPLSRPDHLPTGMPFPWEQCQPNAKDVAASLAQQPGMAHVQVLTCIEAWVTFIAHYYGQPITGVVTWENCD